MSRVTIKTPSKNASTLKTPSKTPSSRKTNSISKSPSKLGNSRTQTPIKLVAAYTSKEKEKKVSSPSFRRMPTQEFTGLLSPRKDIDPQFKEITDAIYELSAGRGNLEKAIKSLQKFCNFLPYETYNYDNVIGLCTGSQNCPVDTMLYTLAIGAIMIINNNPIKEAQREKFITYATRLVYSSERYVTFKDQKFPRSRAEQLLAIFKTGRCDYKFKDVNEFLDVEIDKLIYENEKERDSKIAERRRQIMMATLVPKRDAIIKLFEENNFNEIIASGEVLIKITPQELLERYLAIKREWFSKWETAYQGVLYIWKLFREDKTFSLPIMLGVMENSYASFACFGIKDLASREGLPMSPQSSPEKPKKTPTKSSAHAHFPKRK